MPFALKTQFKLNKTKTKKMRNEGFLKWVQALTFSWLYANDKLLLYGLIKTSSKH